MSTPDVAANERSYGCTFGCGNPYDVVVTMIDDATTEFLCFPCLIKMASDVLEAITDGDNPTVQAALQYAQANPQERVPGPRAKKRGHNAPAGTDDPDLIEAFDDVITLEELPEEFK